MNEFETRDEFLKLMGFANYESYLTSELWAWITSNLSKLELSKSCLRCASVGGLVWHHRRYTLDVLVGNFRMIDRNRNLPKFRLTTATHAGNPIVRLCSDCHRFIHFDGDKWIGSMDIVDARLFETAERIAEKRKMRDEDENEFDRFLKRDDSV